MGRHTVSLRPRGRCTPSQLFDHLFELIIAALPTEVRPTTPKSPIYLHTQRDHSCAHTTDAIA
jgi:hypothetical protein